MRSFIQKEPPGRAPSRTPHPANLCLTCGRKRSAACGMPAFTPSFRGYPATVGVKPLPRTNFHRWNRHIGGGVGRTISEQLGPKVPRLLSSAGEPCLSARRPGTDGLALAEGRTLPTNGSRRPRDLNHDRFAHGDHDSGIGRQQETAARYRPAASSWAHDLGCFCGFHTNSRRHRYCSLSKPKPFMST